MTTTKLRTEVYRPATPALGLTGAYATNAPADTVTVPNGNGLAGSAGDIVELVPDQGLAGDFSAFKVHITSNAVNNTSRFFGVLLNDVAATDASVLVCIRGKVYAQIEEGNPISHVNPGLVMDSGSTTNDRAATGVGDIATTGSGAGLYSSFKIIAMAHAPVVSDGLNPVIFNGIEGLGIAIGPVGS